MRRLVLFIALSVMSVAAAAGAVSTAFSTASFTTDSTTTVQATTPGGAANVMSVRDGDGQTATVATPVATAPSVLVTDANGIPLSGVTVVFAVASGGGSVTGATAVSDSSGVASAGIWTLGTTAGANVLRATAAGVAGGEASFTATGIAGPAASCAVAADDYSPVAGTSITVTARLSDRYGNPVTASGVAVRFTVTGGGTFSGADPVPTDASGTATIELTTPVTSGSISRVTASSSDPAWSSTTPDIVTVAGPAATIEPLLTVPQWATVGTVVATPPSVLVTDVNGNPVEGAAVTFSVTSGGGSLDGAEVTTNASGVAAVTSWTLGDTAGENEAQATAGGLAGSPVTFSATGTAGSGARYLVTASDYEPAAGSPVTIVAQLTDQYGNPVSAPGIAVTFTRTGPGTLGGPNPATTGADGRATITLTTASTAGSTCTVTATSTSPSYRTGATPTITTVAAAAGRIVANGGGGQSATVGTAVTTAPSVLLTDINGNPVADAAVTFAVATGGGTVSGASTTTDASGIATVGSWTLGTTAGANTLTAIAAGLSGSSVTFSATAVAGAATQYVVTPSTTSPVAGAGVAVAAQLADRYGNAVATSGLSVTFTKTGGGSFSGSNPATTSSSGVATITLVTSKTAGITYAVTATSTSPSTRTGTTPAITSVAGAVTKITATAGSGQTATVGTAVATNPSVRATDANGNPVPGAVITFSVYSGGGSITGASATTDASGIARVGSWTLGTTPGTNRLRATKSGLTGSVTFTATALVGPAAKYIVTSSNSNPTAGSSVTITARLTDQFGNAVATSGVVVAWSKTGAGGSFSKGTSTTNTSGVATVTFTTGSTRGVVYAVTATDSSARTGTTAAITTK